MEEEFHNLRPWQREAMEAYRVKNSRDFLVTATPGAGKTTFAITLAKKLLSVNAVEQVVVVVPTDHLRTQWADAGNDKELYLDPSASNKFVPLSPDYEGYVLTYAQAASNPALHAARVNSKRTLLIADEIHHAGDSLSWGDAVREAFGGATRRLCLTGTPFRTSKYSTIPFVTYEDVGDGTKINKSDYAYTYADALRDKVVRPVTFVAYTGEATWAGPDGNVSSIALHEADKDTHTMALKSALDPKGEWIKYVLHAAHQRLQEVRQTIPDAGGMVLAGDQESALAYSKILRGITGKTATVVISDDNKADKKIDSYRTSDSEWLVAVRMVSEGVDIPRLAVGVWATNYRTPLFFAQAIGRFVRSRHPREVATVFLPSVKPVLALAASIEEQRNHVIATAPQPGDEDYVDPDDRDTPEEREPTLDGDENKPMASTATFDHFLLNGKALDVDTLSVEDREFLGIPGLLTPVQITAILEQKGAESAADQPAVAKAPPAPARKHEEIAATRKKINKTVSRIALKNNQSHARIHSSARKAVPGPPTATASLDILNQRLEWLMEKI